VVLASGARAAYREVSPILDAFARAHHYVGPFGAGSKMKFVANLLVAIHNVAAAEALVLAMKAGLDPAATLRIVADGAGGSKVLQLRGPMMVEGRYDEATMKLGVFQKDLAIIGEFAGRLGVATPLFSAGIPVYRAAIAAGRAAEDTAAVCAVLEEMSGHRRAGQPRSGRRDAGASSARPSPSRAR
jgi:3-hydroxyisobutyrate dehydrogenase-like beta-hydroxyacid dehydrogenase